MTPPTPEPAPDQGALGYEATIHLAARDLAEGHGLHVFPVYEPHGRECACGAGSTCKSPAKHPRTANGLKDASSDLSRIDRWWREWPTANVAVGTGAASGV